MNESACVWVASSEPRVERDSSGNLAPTLSTWEIPKARRSKERWFWDLLVVPAHPPGLT